jgi:hypothetical protein
VRLYRVPVALLLIGAVIVSAYWRPKSQQEGTQSAPTEGEKVAAPVGLLLFSAPVPDQETGVRAGTQAVQWPEVKSLPKAPAAKAKPKPAARKTVAVRKPQSGYVSIGGRAL